MREHLLDLTKTYLPALAVVALVTAAFTFGSIFDRFFWQQENVGGRLSKIEEIAEALRTSDARQDTAILRLTDNLVEIRKVLETKNFNAYRFCLNLERINSAKGFRCPEELE